MSDQERERSQDQDHPEWDDEHAGFDTLPRAGLVACAEDELPLWLPREPDGCRAGAGGVCVVTKAEGWLPLACERLSVGPEAVVGIDAEGEIAAHEHNEGSVEAVRPPTGGSGGGGWADGSDEPAGGPFDALDGECAHDERKQ